MSHAKDGPMPHVEVPDAAAAFHKLEDAARRLLVVPKKDAALAVGRGKAAKKHAKRR